mgnify:CR=1 FL=1
MKNTYPNKLEFINVMSSYSYIYASHSAPVDYDILGKSMWLTNLSNNSVRRVILTDNTSVFKNYFVVNALSNNITYRIQAAFYDSMIDSQLLEAKIGYQLSSTVDIKTKIPPTISNYTVTATPVEIGVSLPLISFTLTGDGDTIQVQYRKVGDTVWSGFYEGSSNISPASSIMPGTYEFRVRGLYLLPDGVTQDFSAWYQYPTAITVDYMQIPPSAPTGLSYAVAKINDSFQRYDVKVSWNWTRSTGAPIREFIVYYTTASDYTANGWNKAQIINTGTTQYCILNNFPYNIPYKLKVVARAWGLEAHAYATSTILDLVINSSTIFDNTFTKLTGIDVNYSGIFGYLDPTGARTQTFKLDAGTGAVQIGTPDATTGIVPFSFDPINKKLNVDGSVITNSIYSANFILTNLTGTPPVLRSQEKLSYGDANQGLWAGYSGTAFKFDLGNSSQYVRWDGTTLRISGNVVIGTPTGDLSLSAGVTSTNTVFIYKSSPTVPTTPSSTVYPPSGWLTTPPSYESGKYIYVSQGKIDVLTNQLKSGEVWTVPTQWSGTAGVTPYIEVTADNLNSTAAGFSGHTLLINNIEYSYTRTRGHTLYIINPSTQVVESAVTYDTYGSGTSTLITAINAVPINKILVLGSWDACTKDSNLVAALANFGGSDQTTWAANRYSHVFIGIRGLSFGQAYEKSSNASTIEGVVKTGAYFGSGGIVANGVVGADGAPGATGATGPAGANGANGQRGPGTYMLGIAGFSTWLDTNANSFFTSTFGTGPVLYDVLTEYNTSNVATAVTRMWNGSAWTAPALMVHGDMIATGTIKAEKMVADVAFFQKAGINTIYNNAAAISGNPESVYTMKIDLQNGFIHIR